jgi:hypothetical protein
VGAILGVINFRAKNGVVGAFIVGILLVPLLLSSVALAVPDPNLAGGSPVTGYSATPTPITDLQITGTGNPTVPVKLRVTSGSLAMATTTGLTFTGSSTGATLQFSGTLSNINTALTTLTYTRTGTGTDTLEASLVSPGEVFFPDNGHLYEYVSFTATWGSAKTAAEGRVKYGATGYLTTITSQAENDFVKDRLLNAGWMGASDAAVEGDWKWVTGQENNTSFWSGASGGSTVGGRYANWGTGEPNNAGDEDCAQFLTGGTGKWNDLPCSSTTLPGYVVEYGSDVSPLDIAAKNVSITTQPANQYPAAPTTLGPTQYVNASWGSDNTPTFTFNVTDPDVANTVRYRIQVDDSMNFSSPVVDYTSALATQGAVSFTVGQSTGGGSYTMGSAGQSLTDRQYYWRVKAIDNIGAESAYSAANSGNIAFRLDTGAPETPPAPTPAHAVTSDATPTWSWDNIEDEMSGFGTLRLEWSQDATFAGTVFNAQTDWPAFSSFTHSTPLADGIWYFRTRATDAAGNVSSYSSNGSILIDTTDPTAPGTPTTTTPSATNKPTWVWTSSTDAGAGMSTTQPYTFDFTQDQTFQSYTSYNSLPTPTFTHTEPLSDGVWYARAIAFDELSHSTVSAALGSVVVDTTPPSAPGSLTASLPQFATQPTVAWSPSTDSGVGFGTNPYSVEWSQNADFTGATSISADAHSFTVPAPLVDGTWYFRVRAMDSLGNMGAYSPTASVTVRRALPEAAVQGLSASFVGTGAGTAGTAGTETATATSPGTDILLDDFDEYARGKGKELSLGVGQKVTFYVGSELHSVTIKEVYDSYIVVTVASLPHDLHLALNQSVGDDVNSDGNSDIIITFKGAQQAGALVQFETPSRPDSALAQAANSSHLQINWWWVLAVAAVAGAIVAWWRWGRK